MKPIKINYPKLAPPVVDPNLKTARIRWLDMRRRCYDKQAKGYDRYGGVGIGIDPRWDDFDAFVADMGLPKGSQSLKRINLSKHFTKSNCYWE